MVEKRKLNDDERKFTEKNIEQDKNDLEHFNNLLDIVDTELDLAEKKYLVRLHDLNRDKKSIKQSLGFLNKKIETITKQLDEGVEASGEK